MVDTRYGGIWARTLAALADGFILQLGTTALMVVAGLGLAATGGPRLALPGALGPAPTPAELLDQLTWLWRLGTGLLAASLVLNLVYSVALTAWSGATLGKRMLNLRVVRADGGPVGLGRALVRYGVYLLEAHAALLAALGVGAWGALRALRAVAAGDEPPDDLHALGLLLLGLLGLALLTQVGLLSIAWDRRRQAWHDKLAGTVVVEGS